MAGVRERVAVGWERLSRWVLLEGDRRAVALVELAVIAVFVGPIGHLFTSDVASALDDNSTVTSTVSTLLSGNFLLVSIVVSVSSVFATQEQSPLGQQFGRVQDVVEFRRSLEDVIDHDHAPADPGQLLRLLVGDILERAQALETSLSGVDVDVRADLQSYVETLGTESGEMNERLDRSGRGDTLTLLLATFDYDHDRQINDLRRIRAEHGDAIPEAADETIEEMLRLLQYLAALREYFKTQYLREAFADLSRGLVFLALPSIVVVSFTLLHLNRLPDSELLIGSIYLLSLAPFALLAAYVVRVAAVSKRTRAAGQFAVDDPGEDDGIPWSGNE
jgi:hypothetical protein